MTCTLNTFSTITALRVADRAARVKQGLGLTAEAFGGPVAGIATTRPDAAGFGADRHNLPLVLAMWGAG